MNWMYFLFYLSSVIWLNPLINILLSRFIELFYDKLYYYYHTLAKTSLLQQINSFFSFILSQSLGFFHCDIQYLISFLDQLLEFILVFQVSNNLTIYHSQPIVQMFLLFFLHQTIHCQVISFITIVIYLYNLFFLPFQD